MAYLVFRSVADFDHVVYVFNAQCLQHEGRRHFHRYLQIGVIQSFVCRRITVAAQSWFLLINIEQTVQVQIYTVWGSRLTWGCDELMVQLVSHQRLWQRPETAEHVADTPSLSAHSHTAWLGLNTAVYLQLTVVLSYFAWTITGAIHLDMKEIMHSFEDLFEDFHTEKFVL